MGANCSFDPQKVHSSSPLSKPPSEIGIFTINSAVPQVIKSPLNSTTLKTPPELFIPPTQQLNTSPHSAPISLPPRQPSYHEIGNFTNADSIRGTFLEGNVSPQLENQFSFVTPVTALVRGETETPSHPNVGKTNEDQRTAKSYGRYELTIQDPASQRLTWYKPPLTALVIKKVRDSQVIQPFMQLLCWLVLEKRMLVFIEASVLDEPPVTNHRSYSSIRDKLKSFREAHDDLTDKIDFIICLGGDGTLLYASSLFQQSVPPVMAFHLGSLGFLTPFKFDNFQEQVNNVLQGHAALTLRSRLRCIVLLSEEMLHKQDQRNTTPTLSHHPAIPPQSPINLLVLNEVVIDRGPSPYLCNIDLYLDGKRITSVQGDGLIVSTPTGSTAYAVAAGASMMHPSVPAIMVTPICPHSLSFRPIVVPAGVELMISVSTDSRNTAYMSFDGRKRQELKHGDRLCVTTSIYPVPSICSEDQIADWFVSLDECLRWNDRKRQRQMEDLSEIVPVSHTSIAPPTHNATPPAAPPNLLTPDLTQSSSSDTIDSLSEKSEV